MNSRGPLFSVTDGVVGPSGDEKCFERVVSLSKSVMKAAADGTLLKNEAETSSFPEEPSVVKAKILRGDGSGRVFVSVKLPELFDGPGPKERATAALRAAVRGLREAVETDLSAANGTAIVTLGLSDDLVRDVVAAIGSDSRLLLVEETLPDRSLAIVRRCAPASDKTSSRTGLTVVTRRSVKGGLVVVKHDVVVVSEASGTAFLEAEIVPSQSPTRKDAIRQ